MKKIILSTLLQLQLSLFAYAQPVVRATIAADSVRGSITLSVSGGTAPYTYAWSSSETTSSIANKANGTYLVTVTDAVGVATSEDTDRVKEELTYSVLFFLLVGVHQVALSNEHLNIELV